MFFILALPRSRTKWLSEFLTHGDVLCHHEVIASCSDLDELATLGRNGSSETLGLLLWRALYERYPEAKYVLIQRDPSEVEDSMRRQEVPCNVAQIHNAMAQAIVELPALVIDYDHINYRLADIWQHCRGDRMPYGREDMCNTYIAEPVREQLARADHDAIRRLIACNA